MSLIDIVPTVLSLMGAEAPKEVQGVDLSPWLAGRGAGGGGRPLYAETVTATRYYGANSLLGVIVDGWKYIETTRPELYDLRNDPAEAVNLLEREPARADALARTLVAILAAAGRAPGRPRNRRPSMRPPGNAWRRSATWAGAATPRPTASTGARKTPRTSSRSSARTSGSRSSWTTRATPRPGPSARRCSGRGRDSRTATCRCPRSPSLDGQLEAALTAARKAVAVGPRNERAHLQLAGLLKERGDLDGAIAHYRQALEIQPDTPDTRMSLGHALAEKGRLEEAASLLGTAATAQPESAAAATQLGFVLAKQGKLKEAVLSYRRALALDPGSAEAHAYLGSALASQSASGTKPSPTSSRRSRPCRRTRSCTTGWEWPCGRRDGRKRRSATSARR